jgi:hypothetical protein
MANALLCVARMKPTILAEGPYRFVKLIDGSETSSHTR